MDDERSLPLTPLWLLPLAAVCMGAVVAAPFFSGRDGHATVVLPWFIPAVNSLLCLISASVAFLAFGRCGILGDSSSFWVGVGSSQFAVAILFNTLGFPGLTAGAGQLLGRPPNTAAPRGSMGKGRPSTSGSRQRPLTIRLAAIDLHVVSASKLADFVLRS